MASAYTPPGDPTDVLGRRAVALFIDVALLFFIGFALFALLRYRLYANVEGNVCTPADQNQRSTVLPQAR